VIGGPWPAISIPRLDRRPDSQLTILHSPFSIRNSQFHARRMRRRAPVVSGARNAQRALGLRRVRRLFAHFKKAALFSKIKILGPQAAVGPQATNLQ
jgi:hypothetical protein